MEQIEVGDIVLYDGISTPEQIIKVGLNIQRRQLRLPPDTRLYAHSGIIFEYEGKLYQAQTNLLKGLIMTPYTSPKGVFTDRVKILTPIEPLSALEKEEINNYCVQLINENISYDKWSILWSIVYIISKGKLWLGRKKKHTNKLYCFEATATIFNKIRQYFTKPWLVTSIDIVYNEKFRIKVL